MSSFMWAVLVLIALLQSMFFIIQMDSIFLAAQRTTSCLSLTHEKKPSIVKSVAEDRIAYLSMEKESLQKYLIKLKEENDKFRGEIDRLNVLIKTLEENDNAVNAVQNNAIPQNKFENDLNSPPLKTDRPNSLMPNLNNIDSVKPLIKEERKDLRIQQPYVLRHHHANSTAYNHQRTRPVLRRSQGSPYVPEGKKIFYTMQDLAPKEEGGKCPSPSQMDLPGVQSLPQYQDCRNDPRLIYSSVLHYPPFIIEMPNFVTKEEYDWFKDSLYVRSFVHKSSQCPTEQFPFCKDLDHSKYLVHWTERHIKGKQKIVRDGIFQSAFDCGWFTNHDLLEQSTSYPISEFDRLINLIIPDGWSFQHFLDGVLPKLTQVIGFSKQSEFHTWSDLNSDKLGILVNPSPPNHQMVNLIYDKLGFDISKRVNYNRGSEAYRAKEFIFSCDTPPIHPYLWRKGTELMGVVQSPLEDRNLIVYFSRRTGTVANGGRDVINEPQLLDAIRGLLHERKEKGYGNEELIVFDSKVHSSDLDRLLALLNKAACLIGPHGGAMYNQFFAPADTIIIEFMPIHRYQNKPAVGDASKMIWTTAALLGQNYYTVLCDAMDNSGNMKIEIDKVLDILDLELP